MFYSLLSPSAKRNFLILIIAAVVLGFLLFVFVVKSQIMMRIPASAVCNGMSQLETSCKPADFLYCVNKTDIICQIANDTGSSLSCSDIPCSSIMSPIITSYVVSGAFGVAGNFLTSTIECRPTTVEKGTYATLSECEKTIEVFPSSNNIFCSSSGRFFELTDALSCSPATKLAACSDSESSLCKAPSGRIYCQKDCSAVPNSTVLPSMFIKIMGKCMLSPQGTYTSEKECLAPPTPPPPPPPPPPQEEDIPEGKAECTDESGRKIFLTSCSTNYQIRCRTGSEAVNSILPGFKTCRGNENISIPPVVITLIQNVPVTPEVEEINIAPGPLCDAFKKDANDAISKDTIQLKYYQDLPDRLGLSSGPIEIFNDNLKKTSSAIRIAKKNLSLFNCTREKAIVFNEQRVVIKNLGNELNKILMTFEEKIEQQTKTPVIDEAFKKISVILATKICTDSKSKKKEVCEALREDFVKLKAYYEDIILDPAVTLRIEIKEVEEQAIALRKQAEKIIPKEFIKAKSNIKKKNKILKKKSNIKKKNKKGKKIKKKKAQKE